MSPVTRLSAALRAGLATWLGMMLLLTTVMTAYWAGQNEFPGHSHPPGTPDHVHQLKEVGISGTLSFVLVVVTVTLPAVIRALQLNEGRLHVATRHCSDCARAPPALLH